VGEVPLLTFGTNDVADGFGHYGYGDGRSAGALANQVADQLSLDRDALDAFGGE
jgi:hypothetical protein